MNRLARLLSGGLLPLLILFGVAVGCCHAQDASKPDETKVSRDGSLVTLFYPVPALTGDASLWLNTDKPITFEKGKVYVVHFWTFGCINCKHNLPAYDRWVKH